MNCTANCRRIYLRWRACARGTIFSQFRKIYYTIECTCVLRGVSTFSVLFVQWGFGHRGSNISSSGSIGNYRLFSNVSCNTAVDRLSTTASQIYRVASKWIGFFKVTSLPHVYRVDISVTVRINQERSTGISSNLNRWRLLTRVGFIDEGYLGM